MVILLAIAFFFLRGPGDMATEPVDTVFTPADLQQAAGVPMGEDSAPVLLYEFADYQCPACASFSSFIHPLIKENLVDTGIVRLVRYDFPLSFHPHAFLAARAARCAGDQDRYWEYHDVLYGRQAVWSAMREPSGEFIDYAELVGLNTDTFRACLRSDQHALEVTRNLRLGESLGVSGTPTMMLNGQILDVANYRELEAAVLEAAGRTPAEPAPQG